MKFILALSCVFVSIIACSSSTTATSPSAAAGSSAKPADKSPPCSTGTPYDSSTPFPGRDSGAPLPETECVGRCGDTSRAYWGANGGPSPTVSALPTGACEGAESCHMSAVRLFCQAPPNPSANEPTGALYEFECRCISGQWSCRGDYTAGGGGAYPPCADGGG